MENTRLEDEEENGKIDQREKDLVGKKRKRLPSMDRLRQDLVYQLGESLRSSPEKMNSPELTLAERHHWTQVHTHTAQVFNTVLRDLQMKDWENRLKYIEERDHERRTLPASWSPSHSSIMVSGPGQTNRSTPSEILSRGCLQGFRSTS